MKSLVAVSGMIVLVANVAFGADVECKVGPPVIEFVTRVGSEALTCLDSVTTTGVTRAVLIAKNGETVNGLIVLDVPVSGTPSQVRIVDPTLFPNQCGSYFMGARVLPGAQKVAGLYAANVIRIIDFTDSSSPVVTVGFDDRIPGVGYTCEGYEPNWNAGRSTSRGSSNGVSVDSTERKVLEQYRSQKSVEQIDPIKCNTSQQAFYTRAYKEECTGPRSAVTSVECKDLKTAHTQGVYNIRSQIYPQLTATVSY